ncbi:MAG: hypothetical protein JWR47_2911 [Phenylobacterium sp.]|jgi:hypothetical protein|uniref:hypothetical protein n=1 Tax=Phenylobacterium sp. TaxID=1871053 RepID=UPI002638619B|nr:hypothetical protein [Phenylobacterium sp.]MDB5427523.1 hypothetical protein [Phenylobacterium sp.]MDB5436654.1 hypothetical protein [Phenylobacterium sp.]MDB5496721.1 hypothetical protein [Phenylobacterium sp.]
MPNLIWPRALSSDVGPSGLIGRSVHWLGVAVAIAFLFTAMGLAADGWAPALATWLTAGAVATALAARGVRYLLARE